MKTADFRSMAEFQERAVDTYTDIIDDLVDTMFYDAIADFRVTDTSKDDDDDEIAQPKTEAAH